MTSLKKFAATIGLPSGVGIADFAGLRGPLPVSLQLLTRHAAGAIHVLWEPRPDMLSGDGTGRPDTHGVPLPELGCLGECLELQFSLDPLFHRDTSGSLVVLDDEYLTLRQGMLKNCPLVACLVAMAQSPGYRPRLIDMVREVHAPILSSRQPGAHESCSPEIKTPRCVKGRLPRYRGYSSDTHFVVEFQRRLTPSDFVERPSWLDGNVVEERRRVHVTGTLYRDLTQSPAQLHYAHIAAPTGESKGQPIWPGIIEKAYAVAVGNNGYESLNHGIEPVRVLRDVAGPSTDFAISGLTREEIIKKLRRCKERPVVLSTHDDLPESSFLAARHTVAVVDVHVHPKTKRAMRMTIFDAANGVRHPFPLTKDKFRVLRSTFDRLAQLNRPAKSGAA